MTRGSILEYAEAIRGRYFAASKKEKERMSIACHPKGAT